MKVDVPMLAMTHCDAAKLSKQHGKNSQYALCASQWHKSLTYKDKFFGTGMKYAKDFEKQFKYDPPYQSAESSAALLVFKDAFSQDVRLGILDAAERTGSEIIIDDKLPKELNDMAATLVKVKQMKPDVLVVSGHTKGALTAIRQIAEMKVDVPMLAMTHCDAAKLSKQHGKNSQYALCASQWHKTLTYKDNFFKDCLLYTSPSPRDRQKSRMPSSA